MGDQPQKKGKIMLNKIPSSCNLPWKPPAPFPNMTVRAGKNSHEYSTLGVSNDIEAIAVWLADTGAQSKNTSQSYRREVERLLLWSTSIKDKSISELHREDILEFAAFLKNLPSNWIMTKRLSRSDSRWKPYINQPAPSTQARTLTIINAMFKYLVQSGWLKLNPMPKIHRQKKQASTPTLRSLDSCDISIVKEAIDNLPSTTPKEATTKARDEWLFYLFLSTGARASEASLTMGNFKKINIGGQRSWFWEITGKGNKTALIPLSKPAVVKMMSFRSLLKIPPTPKANDPIPIIPSLRKLNQDGGMKTIPEPLSRRGIDKRLKMIFKSAMKIAAERNMPTEQLQSASTHWLRHTSIREFYDSTGDIKLTQQFARHDNINTTAAYANQDISNMLAAINAMNDNSI